MLPDDLGYSLPNEDYVFKRILRNAFRNHSEIDLFVLIGSHKGEYNLREITEKGYCEIISDPKYYFKLLSESWVWTRYLSVFQTDLIKNFERIHCVLTFQTSIIILFIVGNFLRSGIYRTPDRRN